MPWTSLSPLSAVRGAVPAGARGDRQQLEPRATVVKHRVVHRRETPDQQHLLTLLM